MTRSLRSTLVVTSVLVALAGCGGGGGTGTDLERGPTVAGFEFTAGSAVGEGAPIEVRYTCDGENVSPALEWAGVPEGTVELALAVEDPDAPRRTFTHWLAWGVDPGRSGLAEGEAPELEGRNDFGDTGYGGPCPPRGEEHRYVFRLLALDAAVDLERGADRQAFDAAVAALVLAEARRTATYERP